MNNKIKKKSPLKAWWAALPVLAKIGIIGGGLLAAKGIKNASKADKNLKGDLTQAQAEFDGRLADFEKSQFQPIDSSIVDQENIFEDMEVDTSGFEMQRKAFLQQQANILQSLQSVSGSSGAAGLATALSAASNKQTEQMGMSVTQMLNRAKELRYQEEARIGAAVTNVKLANAEGSRQFEIDKLNTLLGVAGQKIAGIRGQQAGRQQMYGQIASGVGSLAGSIIGAKF
jgi:hypothetical protein|tara:strand:- start:68 stop:754 length:687 start_codon:yes stop_codon:yes gene_type:complete